MNTSFSATKVRGGQTDLCYEKRFNPISLEKEQLKTKRRVNKPITKIVACD